jgi:LPXTG-site transpeptidase (sortase) family protein
MRQRWRGVFHRTAIPPIARRSIGSRRTDRESTTNRRASRLGQSDNLGIAGHRDGFFRGLKDISIGDVVELDTLARAERFVVTEITVTAPSDVEVLDPTEEPSLTLVTCYPFYFVGSAPQRYIVRAVRQAGLSNANEPQSEPDRRPVAEGRSRR